MYYYAKKDKSEFGVTLEQLRLRINQPDMPAETTEIGDWVSYVGKDAPHEIPWYQFPIEVYPVNGVMTWEIHELPADVKAQIEAERTANLPIIIRNKRNELLAATDWTQGKDIPSAISDVWATYRQALRDIPQQADFPNEDMVWPVKPV